MQIQYAVKSENFSSDSYSVFVGRFNYPNINVGVLAPPEHKEDAWLYDAPSFWSQNNFHIPKIVDLRSSLLNNRFVSNVLDARKQKKYLELTKEVAMASKPVALEINLKDKPKFRLQLNDYALPMGPPAILKNIFLTENPKIERKVDYIVSDADLKANDAIITLYQNKIEENSLTKLLSVGNLGLKKDRKLVPTRWSITSVDSNIGNFLIKKIKDYDETGYFVFFGNYLGNYFLILMFPEVWNYELFETYVSPYTTPNSNLKYTTDYEPYNGRKKYAEQTAGGFYAARIAIAEKLNEMRRQASVLALRFITEEYTIPLGVFVVREAVRKAMNSKPIQFSSKDLMLEYAKKLAFKKFNFNLDKMLEKSILLMSIKQQSKLIKFL